MKHFHFRDFLGHFDAQGALRCVCGQVHRLETRETLVEPGALVQSVRLLADRYGRTARLWVLSDENTEAAAAARWKEAAGAGRIVSHILPGRPVTVPTIELVRSLAAAAQRESPALLVAIGSGVISDLGKSVSQELGVPNWCIATAPSVDAFSSATSALRVDGFHSAVPARIAEVIVADPEIVAAAPRELFLAGLGDLLAKYLAHLDWNVARMVSGEWYCPLVAATALDSARSALGAGRMLRRDPAEAVRTLTDAALSSGFAMQATGGSRPAASAEHMLAHFWETTDVAANRPFNLHGILAAAASRLVLPMYRALYARLRTFEPDDAARRAAFDAELPWTESMEEGLRPFHRKIAEQAGSRVLDREILARRLTAFRENRQSLIELADKILGEMEQAVQILHALDYPLSFGTLGIPEADVLLPLRNVRLLRQRYSSFDLAYELGLSSFMREQGEKSLREMG